ncbi:carboxypeptidase-like regulatory domain-containing protein [uncultured Winogradskyella sp.]|uniref:carboxypeptidase-like regulatory domain-containing protein n=1 Tax=Winogradskyella sp. 4-2091 TaxID=3381659 RepID=UPI002626FC46|nr:carboxypeptidase-like regulatory domain-containing protein [uncultured Winogradskyella sp.]
MKKISFLLFLISINLINSQTINGTVKDSVTGENVAFANIVLKNGKGTYSNEFGGFELEIKNFTTDTLKISNLGYESKILPLINLKKAIKFEILLKPRVENLDEVLISSKKIKYTDKKLLGDKKEGNIGVTSLIGYETAIFIDNPKNIKGKLKRIYIDLKKRKNAEYIATLNIKIYELDSINNKPRKLLHNKNLYVKPKNKKYRLWIDVKDFDINFPINGVFIGIEMVNTFGKVKKYARFGPMFRYTINKDKNARTWSNYHNSGWKGSSIEHKKFKRTKTGISNPMVGIEVLYPKE